MKRAAIFAAMLGLLPLAAQGQNEIVTATIPRSFVGLKLSPIPGWRFFRNSLPYLNAKTGLMPNGSKDPVSAPAILSGTSVVKLDLPANERGAEQHFANLRREMAGPANSLQRLSDIRDARGRTYFVYRAGQSQTWTASAIAEDGKYLSTLMLSAHSESDLNRYLPAFNYLVSHYSGKAPR